MAVTVDIAERLGNLTELKFPHNQELLKNDQT
jgi:hypothetical protein